MTIVIRTTSAYAAPMSSQSLQAAVPDRSQVGQLLARLLVAGQTIIVASYLLLAVVPYFAHGIHNTRYTLPQNPKDLFPMKYTTSLLPSLDVTIGPYIAGALAGGGALLFVLAWHRLSQMMRTALLVCIAAGVAFIVVQTTGLGADIRYWIHD